MLLMMLVSLCQPVTHCNNMLCAAGGALLRYSSCVSCDPQGALHLNDTVVPQPHLLHLSAERLSRDGAFLMDCGNVSFQNHSSEEVTRASVTAHAR